jgi:hypothetical protein
MTQATRKWSLLRQAVVCAVGLVLIVLVLTLSGAVHPAWVAIVAALGGFLAFVAGRVHRSVREG